MDFFLKQLSTQDSGISAANKRLRTVLEKASKANEQLNRTQQQASHNPSNRRLAQNLSKAKKNKENADEAYKRLLIIALVWCIQQEVWHSFCQLKLQVI